MKRNTALNHFETVCGRFDDAINDPVKYIFARPIRVWLIGSTLTEKPEPEDLDLVGHINLDLTRAFEKPGDIYNRLAYGKIPLGMGVVRAFARGLKMVRLMDDCKEDISNWLENHRMPPDTPYRLIWEEGLDWKEEIMDIRQHPLPHNQQAESAHKKANLVGFKRVEKVWKLILQRNAKKSSSLESIFVPLNFRRGFRIVIQTGFIPSELANNLDLVKAIKQDAAFSTIMFRRMPIGEFLWKYEDPIKTDKLQPDLIGIEGSLVKDIRISTSEVKVLKDWMTAQIQDLFKEAGLEIPPLEWIDDVAEGQDGY
jgi:hypothetical protein